MGEKNGGELRPKVLRFLYNSGVSEGWTGVDGWTVGQQHDSIMIRVQAGSGSWYMSDSMPCIAIVSISGKTHWKCLSFQGSQPVSYQKA